MLQFTFKCFCLKFFQFFYALCIVQKMSDGHDDKFEEKMDYLENIETEQKNLLNRFQFI